eukprot:1264486-Rhodomonas_salina.3
MGNSVVACCGRFKNRCFCSWFDQYKISFYTRLPHNPKQLPAETKNVLQRLGVRKPSCCFVDFIGHFEDSVRRDRVQEPRDALTADFLLAMLLPRANDLGLGVDSEDHLALRDETLPAVERVQSSLSGWSETYFSYFSFCLREYADDYNVWHCKACGSCCGRDQWHCGVCNTCHDDPTRPCETCTPEAHYAQSTSGRAPSSFDDENDSDEESSPVCEEMSDGPVGHSDDDEDEDARAGHGGSSSMPGAKRALREEDAGASEQEGGVSASGRGGAMTLPGRCRRAELAVLGAEQSQPLLQRIQRGLFPSQVAGASRSAS